MKPIEVIAMPGSQIYILFVIVFPGTEQDIKEIGFN